jgi:hypothetical protein
MSHAKLFAHPDLLVFVSAKDPDFSGIFLKEPIDDLMAKRAGTAGNQHAFA